MIRLSVPPRWSLPLRRARVVVFLFGVLFVFALMTQLLGGLLVAGPLLGLVLLLLVVAAGSAALLLVERWVLERVADARNEAVAAAVLGELGAVNQPAKAVPYGPSRVTRVPELVPDDDLDDGW